MTVTRVARCGYRASAGRIRRFRYSLGHGAAELQPVEMKIGRAPEQPRGAYEAAPQPPGFFEGGGVSSLLGEGGLAFRQTASSRFQHRATTVQSLGRGFNQ